MDFYQAVKKEDWMIKTIGFVTCFVLCLAGAQPAIAQQVGHWGVGGVVNFAKPTFGLSDRWGSVPTGGITLTYAASSQVSVEVEYHYSKFNDGSLENTPFTWGVDGLDYTSPEAVHEMQINSVLLNSLLYLWRDGEAVGTGFEPYLTVGSGLYAYRTKVEKLIYPGQAAEPLNKALFLPDQADVRTALGVNMGLGANVPLGEKMALDVRARYNVIFGYLRPHLAWGVAQTSFFQMLDVGAGLKFYF